MSCAMFIFRPTPSYPCCTYWRTAASAEISVVGNEGLIGVALFMGGETTPSRAIVQSAGHAYRLIGQQLKEEFHRNGQMQLLLLRYTQALITQMAQTAVCNRHHSVDQQLCRWLLLSLDRLSSSQLTMTQELIANMLGVRREGVTDAAGKLQKLGVIRYARGQITVLDRHKLEQLCCECYAVVRRKPIACRRIRMRSDCRNARGLRSSAVLPRQTHGKLASVAEPVARRGDGAACRSTRLRTTASPMPSPDLERGAASSAGSKRFAGFQEHPALPRESDADGAMIAAQDVGVDGRALDGLSQLRRHQHVIDSPPDVCVPVNSRNCSTTSNVRCLV